MASLKYGLEHYWHAPFFYPADSTLAFSEPLTGSMIFAPLVRLFGSPIPAYNAFVWFTLVLNGLAARQLLLQLNCRNAISLAGGLAFCFHPLALQNLEAIQLAVLWPTLWCISLLFKISIRPSLPDGLLLGLSFSLQCFFCLHHLLFWLLLLPWGLWIIFPYHSIKKGFACLAVAALTSICLASPIVIKVMQTHEEYGFSRSSETVRVLSASLADWLTSQNLSWANLLGLGESSFPLLPGLFRISLAATLLFWGRRLRSKTIQFLIAIGVISICLSFGARWSFGSTNLWETACEYFSPLASVRSPYRFAYFSQASIILLAAIALDQGWTHFNAKIQPNRVSPSSKVGSFLNLWLFRSLMCLCLVLLALEIRPPQSFLNFPPSPRRPEAWVQHIQRNVHWESAILCLPIAEFNTEKSQQRETSWMLYATQHTRPIANGYSGFTPPFWGKLRKALRGSLDNSVLDLILSEEIKVIVLRTDQPQSVRYLTWLKRVIPESALEFQDDRYMIFRVAGDRKN